MCRCISKGSFHSAVASTAAMLFQLHSENIIKVIFLLAWRNTPPSTSQIQILLARIQRNVFRLGAWVQLTRYINNSAHIPLHPTDIFEFTVRSSIHIVPSPKHHNSIGGALHQDILPKVWMFIVTKKWAAPTTPPHHPRSEIRWWKQKQSGNFAQDFVRLA